MVERWFGLVRSLGMVQILTDHFGEVPVTSLDKCALRKINSGDGIEWHQDGSFLGVESGALNLWVSLSDTEGSPGLDIVRRRFTEIVETGTGGAGYDWSTGPEVVATLAETWPIAQPHFRPGDAVDLRRDAPAPHHATAPAAAPHPLRHRDLVLLAEPVPPTPAGADRVLSGPSRPRVDRAPPAVRVQPMPRISSGIPSPAQ